jgi:hypothetical protein
MKTLISIFISILLISTPINASLFSKATKAGGAYVAYKAFKVASKKGSPRAKKFAIVSIKNYIKKNPEKIATVTALFAGFAVQNSDLANQAASIMEASGLIDSHESNELVRQSNDYEKAYLIVNKHLTNISLPQSCNANKLDKLTHTDYTDFMDYSSFPVRTRHVGSYDALTDNAVVGDNLEHDHVPSFAAIMKHLAVNLNTYYKPNSPEYNAIRNNTTTIEVTKLMHSQGRTYKEKNNLTQIKSDSKDLKDATIKDFAYHLMNSNFDSSILQSFTKAYKRNAALCLYSI